MISKNIFISKTHIFFIQILTHFIAVVQIVVGKTFCEEKSKFEIQKLFALLPFLLSTKAAPKKLLLSLELLKQKERV